MTLAVITSNPDLAEICFLVALIVFVVGLVVSFMRSSVELAILFGGLAVVALGWLLL